MPSKDEWLAVLLHDRNNHDALLGLGSAFVAEGDLNAARTVFAQATMQHPESAPAHAAYGSVLLETDELDLAAHAFASALARDPSNRKAIAGLAVAYERAGDIERADVAWRAAFANGGLAHSTYSGAGEPVRVLLLWSAGDGNVPVKHVLDARMFLWTTLFVESFHDGMPLPRHEVVLNAIGDADVETRALAKAGAVVAATDAPVINPPSVIRQTGRVDVARRLRDVEGVVAPNVELVTRAQLLGRSNRVFPLLVRSPGHHSGAHFVRVDEPSQLAAAVAEVPGERLLAISYVDTRDATGIYRKYRAMCVDGRVYPLHVAASTQWKVHHFSADRETALAFPLDDATREVLERVAAVLQLDYGGIDYALDAQGRVVVFEANATMGVTAAATEVIAAAQAMIAARAGRPLRGKGPEAAKGG